VSEQPGIVVKFSELRTHSNLLPSAAGSTIEPMSILKTGRSISCRASSNSRRRSRMTRGFRQIRGGSQARTNWTSVVRLVERSSGSECRDDSRQVEAFFPSKGTVQRLKA